MTTDGPDMTPQGISNAIDALVTDLPQPRTKRDDSWQRVLGLQLLNRACASVEFRRALYFACGQILDEEPAFREALVEAFGVTMGSSGGDTPFATSPLGRLLDLAIHDVWMAHAWPTGAGPLAPVPERGDAA